MTTLAHTSPSVSTIRPHGGRLIDRTVPGDEYDQFIASLADAPSLALDDISSSDLYMIAVGAYSPLSGFLTEAEYNSVVETMQLDDGTLWPLPVTLPVRADDVRKLRMGQVISLTDTLGRMAGAMEIASIWQPDLDREAEQVYRTTDRNHPGVARLHERGDWYIGGTVRAIAGPPLSPELAELALTPKQTRALFAERQWRRVVAFQTRNPVHRAHEYIQKCALEMVDGLLLHPLVGATKSDDIPAGIRMRSYQVLLERYYPQDRVLLAAFPAAMRYAGPREALFHAIARQNYGCTHFIVGRDHAGVGNYYGTYDAQRIFDVIQPGRLAITPVFFEHTFFCYQCQAIVSQKTCPHGTEHHLVVSGTEVRARLRRGEPLPLEFSRTEVIEVLRHGFNGNGHG
jgi:sulfate adenylyltransferase